MRRRRVSWFDLRHLLLLFLLLVLFVLSNSAAPFAAASSSDDEEDSGVEDRDDEDGYDAWPEERSLLNPKPEEREEEEESCPASCLCNDSNRSAACDADGDDLSSFLASAAKLLHSSSRIFINNFRAGGALTSDTLPSLSLSELSLTGGALPAIAGNSTFSPFDGGHKLTRLDLSGNSLAAVGSEALSGLPNLRLLRLSDNSLSNVPDINLPALLSLSLKGNRLTELNARCLAGTPALRSVDLSSNRIAHVAPTALHGLSALTRLILTDNPLLHLERLDAFGAARLRVVDVSRAGLSRIPSTLARSVRDLRVEGNNVGAIRRGDLDPYPLVERLSLDGNRIDIVEEDALGRLEVLIRLRLGGNRLGAVPRSLPTALRHLHLQDNRMVALRAGDLHGLTRLETLDISSNEIREVEAGALAASPSLHMLSLRGNQLTAIPVGTFKGLRELISLDLSNNPIKHLDSSTFNSLTSLKELRLTGAGSAEADAAELFAPLASLKTLDLSGSPWLAIDLTRGTGEALRPLRGLRNLDLSRCGLHSLPPDMPLLLPDLRMVILVGNEWYCKGKEASSAYALSQWLRNPGETVILEAEDIRCTIPEHLRSTPMALLREEDFGIMVTTESTTVPEPTSTANASTTSEQTTTTAFAIIKTTKPPENANISEVSEKIDMIISSTTNIIPTEPKPTTTSKIKILMNATTEPILSEMITDPLSSSTLRSETPGSNPTTTETTELITGADQTKSKMQLPSALLHYNAVKFTAISSTAKPIQSTIEAIKENSSNEMAAPEERTYPPTDNLSKPSSSSASPTSGMVQLSTQKPVYPTSSITIPPSINPSSSDTPNPGRSMGQALARSGEDVVPNTIVVPPSDPTPSAVHAAAPITLGLLGTCVLFAALGALYRKSRGINRGMGGGTNRGGGTAGTSASTSASGRRASASIAYRPHRDEVSIATVAGEEEEEEDGVGERRKGLPYSRPVALW